MYAHAYVPLITCQWTYGRMKEITGKSMADFPEPDFSLRPAISKHSIPIWVAFLEQLWKIAIGLWVGLVKTARRKKVAESILFSWPLATSIVHGAALPATRRDAVLASPPQINWTESFVSVTVRSLFLCHVSHLSVLMYIFSKGTDVLPQLNCSLFFRWYIACCWSRVVRRVCLFGGHLQAMSPVVLTGEPSPCPTVIGRICHHFVIISSSFLEYEWKKTKEKDSM